MAQHDYNLANQNGAAFRADLNSALAAIQSANSGATEPASTVAYMPWADTNAGAWKVRNAADSAWVSVMSLTASRVDTAAGTSYDNASSGLAATNVKDAIDEIVTTAAEKATTGQAEAGADDTAYMTPLKTKQQGDVLIPPQDQPTWNAGTDTTESRISPAKLDAKIKTLAIGEGQTWQSVIGSRAVGTTYYNTTGKPISLNITATMSSGSASLILTVQGEAIIGHTSLNVANQAASIHVGVIPAGASYVLSTSVGSATLGSWKELR